MSLRIKIFLVVAGIGLALTALFFYTWIPSAEEDSQHILENYTHDELAITAEALTPLLLQNQYAVIYETLDALLTNNPEWVAIKLYDDADRLIYPLIPPVTSTGNGQREVVHDIRLRGQKLGTAILTVDFSESLASLHKQKLELFRIFAIGLFLGLAAIMMLLDRFVRRPALNLADASEHLAMGDYSTPLPKATSDEIGSLTNSFKSMRDAIRENEAALREARERFDAGLSVADAARDIALGDFSAWGESERIAINVDTLFREFSGDTTEPDVIALFDLLAALEHRAS